MKLVKNDEPVIEIITWPVTVSQKERVRRISERCKKQQYSLNRNFRVKLDEWLDEVEQFLDQDDDVA